MSHKADILIVTATKLESQAVIQAFKEFTREDSKPIPIENHIYHKLGKVHDLDVFMALTEMGSGGLGGSQETVRRAIEALTPNAVIMVGIAFGINQQKQAVGEILVSQQLLLYELQRVGVDKIISRGDKPHSDPRLMNWFRNSDLYWNRAGVHFGLLLSGEKLIDNVDYRDQLKQFEPEAIGGEMEGAGLYVACQTAKVDWILVKGICDWADGNKGKNKKQRQELAARNAAEFVLHTLQQASLQNEATSHSHNASHSTIPLLETVSRLTTEVVFPIFQVPFRPNPNFTGRERELETLHENLISKLPAVVTQAIAGLGGVGKTQLALHYAYAYASEYDLVWWVRAEELATITDDFITLANRLNLPIKIGAEQTVFINVVQHWLKNAAQKWLLIFDNAENPDVLQKILPEGRNGHVLITSRNPNWGHLAKVLEAQTFTIGESKHFLLKRTGQKDEISAEKIAVLLGGLPLALEQAGAYMTKRNTPLSTYVHLYQKQRSELWARETPPTDYRATVTTTWEMAFLQIRQSSPEAIELLNLCIFLAPDDIPLSLFQKGVSYLPSILSLIVSNPIAFEDALAALYQYSLIKREGENLSIHRLVQDVARERLKKEESRRWIEIVIQLVEKAFPFDKHDIKTWRESASWLPHVEIASGYAAENGVALEQVANLQQRTGEFLREQGEYDKAKLAIEQGLEIRQEILGEDHPAIAESLDYLGELYQEKADYEKAQKNHEHALTIREKTLGLEHEATAKSLNNLGYLYDAKGEYEKAHPYYEEALTIRKQVLGDVHPETATSLNNLGYLYNAKGEYEKARPYYEEALTIRKQVLGDVHPDTASSLSNLGGLYYIQGEYEKARSYFEEALAIRKQVLGDVHPDTSNSLNNLGALLMGQGKYSTARKYLQEALGIFESVHGNKHPTLVKILINLGTILLKQGQFVLARRYIEQAREICRNAKESYSECLELEVALKQLPGKIGRPQNKKKPQKQFPKRKPKK